MRKLSAQSINTFVSAVQFLYLTTLEMTWRKEDFPRPRVPQTLPVVLAPEEVQHFFEHVNGIKYRAVLLACYGSLLAGTRNHTSAASPAGRTRGVSRRGQMARGRPSQRPVLPLHRCLGLLPALPASRNIPWPRSKERLTFFPSPKLQDPRPNKAH